MSAISNCLSNTLFASNELATQWAHRFCECSLARQVLKVLPCPTYVKVGDYKLDEEHIDFFYSKDGIALKSEMRVPKVEGKPFHTMMAFVYEIFNVINTPKAKELAFKSDRGEVGIDEYAVTMERIAYPTQKNTFSLLQKCSKTWDFDLQDLKEIASTLEYIKSKTEEDGVWLQEVTCHTDILRKSWIDLYKNVYCRKHPEDLRSCRITKSDLCGSYSSLISLEDTCHRLSNTSEQTKEFYRIQLCKSCPDVYEKIGKSCPSVEDYEEIEIVVPEENLTAFSKNLRKPKRIDLFFSQVDDPSDEICPAENWDPVNETSMVQGHILLTAITVIAITALTCMGAYCWYKSRKVKTS